MNINDDFIEICKYAHMWNWVPDWDIVQQIYKTYPDSYSILTPFVYTYLEELIRSTTSEYGMELLDEFDKANTFVYSGLYQMFDEGIFRDNNYEVNLESSLIICTSNYSNLQDIMNQLGAPMFYRINCFIEYKKLSTDTIIKLIDKSFDSNMENLDNDVIDKIEQINLKDFIKSKSKLFNNARQIDNIVKEKMAEVILNMRGK